MPRRTKSNSSGFSSDVSTTGKEVKPLRSSEWDTSNDINLKLETDNTTVFHETDILAVGGYIRPSDNMCVTVSIGDTSKEFSLKKDIWNPVGAHTKSTATTATITTESKACCETVGVTAGELDEEIFTEGLTYDDGKTVKDVFETRTYGCVPYIYYFSHDTTRSGDGSTVMLKSCNRCGRFLPVENLPEREKQSPSFSNHSRMTEIRCVEGEYEGETGELTHGYQLECKACKKFYVNAALNHKRSTAQRREDSLRRREIEELVQKHTSSVNIYESFRKENGIELDEYILHSFDNECFKCGKHLESTEDMHLDHTMPLSYLWPLDESATALCPMCNSAKSDSFPVDFYTEKELSELAEITGLDEDLLTSKKCNKSVIQSMPSVDELSVSDATKQSIEKRIE